MSNNKMYESHKNHIQDSFIAAANALGVEEATDIITKSLSFVFGQHENPVVARHQMNLMFDDVIYWNRCSDEEKKERCEKEADDLVEHERSRRAIRENDALLGDLIGDKS